MAADISTSLKDWSTTEASNSPAGSTAISTNLDDNLRQLQSTVRDVWSRTTVASASTCDIGAVDHGSITVSGTTTITSFGTVSEGIRKWLTFSGALTLTHNSTSLILPTGANITTAAGDTACMESLGSGNWRCLSYLRADGKPVNTAITVSDGTVSAPGIAFASDTNTGIYRIGADNVGIALGGVKFVDLGTTALTFSTPNVTSGVAGSINLTTGTGSDTGDGGDINITAGGAGSGDAAGNINITCSSAVSSGGNITITAAPGSGTSASGGNVAISGGSAGGAGSTTGNITISGGEGTSISVPGGDANVASGSNSASGDPGNVNLKCGGTIVVRLEGATDHIRLLGNAPTITSGGGTGASIAGSDNAFEATFGTSPGTTLRVTFAVAYGTAPLCFANYGASNIAVRCVSTTTYVDVTFASSPAAGEKVQVLCISR